VRISFQIKRPSGAEDFEDEDDMAASCLLLLGQAAKEQQHSRASTQRASTQRAAVIAPVSAPAGLFSPCAPSSIR